MTMYRFDPPTKRLVDAPFYDGRTWGPRTPRDVSLCVLRVAGVWQVRESPRGEDWDAADLKYHGGHVHTVSQTEADALTAGGFGALLTPIEED